MLTAVAADKLIDSSESLQINHSGNRILDGSLENPLLSCRHNTYAI